MALVLSSEFNRCPSRAAELACGFVDDPNSRSIQADSRRRARGRPKSPSFKAVPPRRVSELALPL